MTLDLHAPEQALAGLASADLRISRVRALRGPNYWRLSPVIVCDLLLGSLREVRTDEIPGFSDALLGLLPTLADHGCTRSGEGDFVQRLRAGTHLAHVLEHVAIELQTLAGSEIGFGRAVHSGDGETWWVIVAYEEEDLGVRAVRESAEIVRACLAGEVLDIEPLLHELQTLYRAVRLGPSTAAIVEEARRRNIPVRRLNSGSLVQLGLGSKLRRIQAAMSDSTSAIAVDIAQDKNETRRMLDAVGLPVPAGRSAHSVDDALATVREIGYPVILKPVDGSQGRGFSGKLEDEDALRRAWGFASGFASRLLVEQFVEGRDYRVLVVGGRFVAVAERVCARVVGDGMRTIRELIAEINDDPRRGDGHESELTRIIFDERTEAVLLSSGIGPDSVPAAGDVICLSPAPNLSSGGTSIDRTDEIHPDNITACEMAACAVGLDIAGIDVVSPDISVPFRRNGARIIEVNAAPGLRMHTHPCEGTPRNVGAVIVDMLFPLGRESRIPVIAVTGTNGKTTTVRLIAHLFRGRGTRVGLSTTDGLYIGNRLIMEGDMTGPFSANIILSNPTVDLAVLETARGGLLRAGLGFDEADVGIVLNVASDHLGLGGIDTVEQLAALKGVIPAVVARDGYAILNVDDPLVLGMAGGTIADVVLFTRRPPGGNPYFEDHLRRGGIGARVEEGDLVVRRGRQCIPIAAVTEVPLMLGGVARFQLENILAAISAAYVQGLRYDEIRAGLLSFFPSPGMTPGRMNLMRIGNAHVLVDYAHNAPAVAAIVDLARGLPARRRVGVVTTPGDRRDEDIRAVGRAAAGFDHLIIREDADLRGRREGEIARLIREGVMEARRCPSHIEVVLSEPIAVAHAIGRLRDGDLAVILAERVGEVLRQIRPLIVGGSST